MVQKLSKKEKKTDLSRMVTDDVTSGDMWRHEIASHKFSYRNIMFKGQSYKTNRIKEQLASSL